MGHFYSDAVGQYYSGADIYVLHCFKKKTQKTSRTDLDLAAKRYRDLLKELGQ